jgi:hypothetical protein
MGKNAQVIVNIVGKFSPLANYDQIGCIVSLIFEKWIEKRKQQKSKVSQFIISSI